MSRGWNVARSTVVALLAWAAYWAALPWIDCIREFPTAEVARACTFGVGIAGFPPPTGWNAIVGAVYLAAALWVLARRGQ
jgi:hypothetical protein